jgi:hypothetical protein
VFEALVLACLIGDPTDCIQLENTRHPLRTYAQCEARAMEMGSAVNKYMTGYKAISWKCTPLQQGKFTNVDSTYWPNR